MDQKLSIKITIADRPYPLSIEREEEENIRKAQKLINDKILLYKERFTAKGRDDQDWLAMTALQFATQTVAFDQLKQQSNNAPQIQLLCDSIDEYLARE